MSNVLKISEAASLALDSMIVIAANPDRFVPAREIASEFNASQFHLSKVLQRLSRVGLVKGIRGPKGGFTLGKAGEDIRLLDIYESIEGPFVPKRCFFGTPVCIGETCILDECLRTVEERIKRGLAKTKLSELASVYRNKRKRERSG